MKQLFFTLTIYLSVTSFANNNFNLTDTNENYIVENVLNDFFNKSDIFFGKYISEGKVDYESIKTNHVEIINLTNAIGNADLSEVDNNTKLAFYLNAYNLLVIKQVVDALPISKPTDVKGFFDTNKHNVAGEYISLNDIENKKLRPDPRVHFSLVCAAKGCPKITNEAFRPENVQQQLNAHTSKAINDADFLRVDNSTKTAKISMLFEWYKEDFIKSDGSVINFINKYRDVKIPSDYIISTYEYDWDLNKK